MTVDANAAAAGTANPAAGLRPTSRQAQARTIVAAALGLGTLADALLRIVPWGLNATLWTFTAAATLAALHRSGKLPLPSRARAWLLLLLCLSVSLAWRDAPSLKALSLAASLAVPALAMLRARAGLSRAAGLLEIAVAAAASAFYALFGALPLLSAATRDMASSAGSRRAVAALRGLVIAAPLLLVFALLFASADAVFEGLVRRGLDLVLDDLFAHGFVTAFAAWTLGGVLWGLAAARSAPPAEGRRPAFLALSAFEVGVVLALLDLLFAAFVLVQLRYLFGGAALVDVSPGLTYAEYARRGFFELVAAAALALPLLLALHWLLRGSPPSGGRAFQVLAALQLALLGLVMLSAAERLRLYVSQYGLTELRLYTAALMSWIAALCVWFSATVLRGRRERFA